MFAFLPQIEVEALQQKNHDLETKQADADAQIARFKAQNEQLEAKVAQLSDRLSKLTSNLIADLTQLKPNNFNSALPSSSSPVPAPSAAAGHAT